MTSIQRYPALALVLALTLALGGCVSAHATMLTPHRYAPVPPDEVRIFLASDEVPDDCERLVLIHSSGSATWTSEKQMIRKAREKAGRAGADAVLLRSLKDPKLAERVVSEVFSLPSERKGEMIGYRCH
jgi:hypothetical protein